MKEVTSWGMFIHKATSNLLNYFLRITSPKMDIDILRINVNRLDSWLFLEKTKRIILDNVFTGLQ